MAQPVFYFVGGEDIDYVKNGSAIAVDATAGTFDSAFARCSLGIFAIASDLDYWRQAKAFSASAFWFGAAVWAQGNSANTPLSALLNFWDASVITRLRIRPTSSAVWPAQSYVVEKLDSAGAATQLGGSFNLVTPVNGLGRIDVHINYATSGLFEIWINGSVLAFTYSGDVTTNGVTALAGHDLRTSQTSQQIRWSQIVISDSDTRSMSLQTTPPVANGNTHSFDTGTPAAANVNEVTMSDLAFDGSSTAGQIDQYTITSTIAGTGLSVLAFAVSARLKAGFSGPTKMDLGVRSGGADYWSADVVPQLSFQNGYSSIWNTDPATSAAWAALPSNIGLKSVA